MIVHAAIVRLMVSVGDLAQNALSYKIQLMALLAQSVKSTLVPCVTTVATLGPLDLSFGKKKRRKNQKIIKDIDFFLRWFIFNASFKKKCNLLSHFFE